MTRLRFPRPGAFGHSRRDPDAVLHQFTAWVEDGAWNDDVPTEAPTWSSPSGSGSIFTVWDDTEPTT